MMKKRMISLCLALAFAIGSALPAYAAEEWLHLEPSVYSASTSVLAGDRVRDLYLQVGSASYDVYYEFTDQNGNYLIGGTLYGFDGTIIEFNGPYNRPSWFPTSFGSNVTGIQLTLTCSTTNGPCEAYANVNTSFY